MSFQERQKTKNHSDQQGSHLKASVRYLVYSRLSGLQPGGGVVVTSSFSNSIVFKSFHCGERFRNDPFSDRCSVDGSRIRNKTVSFSFENGVVWTGPKCYYTRTQLPYCQPMPKQTVRNAEDSNNDSK